MVSAGVGQGNIVALCSEPTVDLVVGIIGVLKTGAACLVLNPELPPERLDFMLADSGATAILAPPDLADRLTLSLIHI